MTPAYLRRIRGIVLCLLAVLAAERVCLAVTPIQIIVTDNGRYGAGFESFDGSQILNLTITAGGDKEIESTTCTDNTGNFLWYQQSATAESHVWVTIGVLPDFEAKDPDVASHSAVIEGNFKTDASGGSGTTTDEGEGEAAADFAVAINDVDVDGDSDNNSTETDRAPAKDSSEDRQEYPDGYSSTSARGLCIHPDDGWVKLILRTNTKKAGWFFVEVPSGSQDFTDTFELSTDKSATLSAIAKPAIRPHTDMQTMWQEKIGQQSGNTPTERTLYVRVKDDESIGVGDNSRMQLVLAAQPDAGADSQTAVEEDKKACDLLKVTVAGDVAIDVTKHAMADESGNAFVYPCPGLCDDKKFLRYRCRGVDRDDVDEITITLSKGDNTVWTKTWEKSDLPSDWDGDDWHKTFSECITNADNDADGESNQVGGEWKYLDPGNAEGGIEYTANLTVDLAAGGDSLTATCALTAKRRYVLIAAFKDPRVGPGAEGAFRQELAIPRTQPITMHPTSTEPYLKMVYEKGSTFSEAFSYTTPRGELWSMNHGVAMPWPPDGRSRFGLLCMEQIAGGGYKKYAGFSETGKRKSGTKGFQFNDVVEIDDAFSRAHDIFVHLAHCFSAHNSGADDSGPSCAETLSSCINDGKASSGEVKGYIGYVRAVQFDVVYVTYPGSTGGTSATQAEEEVRVAMHRVLKPVRERFSLKTLKKGESYRMPAPTLASHGPCPVLRQANAMLRQHRIQAEVGDEITIKGDATAYVPEVADDPIFGARLDGDDEGGPENDDKYGDDDPQGNDQREDWDDDDNPSGHGDDPSAEDADWPQEVTFPLP